MNKSQLQLQQQQDEQSDVNSTQLTSVDYDLYSSDESLNNNVDCRTPATDEASPQKAVPTIGPVLEPNGWTERTKFLRRQEMHSPPPKACLTPTNGRALSSLYRAYRHHPKWRNERGRERAKGRKREDEYRSRWLRCTWHELNHNFRGFRSKCTDVRNSWIRASRWPSLS